MSQAPKGCLQSRRTQAAGRDAERESSQRPVGGEDKLTCLSQALPISQTGQLGMADGVLQSSSKEHD